MGGAVGAGGQGAGGQGAGRGGYARGGAGGGGGQGAGRGGFARGGAGGGGTPRGCIEYPASHLNNHRGVVAFWNDLTCPLTQWSAHSFTDTDVVTNKIETFHTAENFMMAAKARCAGDENIRNQILHETNPREAKRLGRGLTFVPGPNGFQKWVDQRENVVRAGNLLKFGQNPAAANYLKGTGDMILVEGSPSDDVWGCGCGITYKDPRIQNLQNWNGANKLGKILMEVRGLLP